MKIDHSNSQIAVDLLVKGFPTRTRAFWESGLKRMLNSPAHVSGDVPIGYMLEADGAPVGVGLTPVAPSQRRDGAHSNEPRRINLASWYVAPAHRWRMPILLRRMMSDNSAIYTDLSPTLEVQPLLKSLGFAPLNNGITVVNLAGAAVMPRSGYAVRAVGSDDADALPQPDAALVRDHIACGCFALALSRDGETHVLILKRAHAKGVPVLQIIYCHDNEVVRNALPDIARFLIKKCHFGLIVENPPHTLPQRTFVNVVMANRRKRFIKNSEPGKGTDFTYSELAFFDF